MNANDYASILENQGHKYIADFVRQQQAEIEALKADSKRLDWIWNEAQYCCFKLEKVRLFTVATQHFTNVYGIRPMIDEAMELAILRKASEK